MIEIIKKAFGKTYYPLNQITISRKNLILNYQYLSSLSEGIAVAPVLKSNAYGHGLINIAKILEPLKPPMFCVDSLYEAYELLKANIKTPILIMGYINPQNLKVKKLPFSYAVYDRKLLEVINSYQKGAEVHIKIDTGMHRLGVPMADLPRFLKEVKAFKNIKVTGLMSHLGQSNPKSPLTRLQIGNFQDAIQIAKLLGFDPKWKHLAATGGLLNLPEISKITSLARVGLALYGIGAKNKNLKPVMELKSQIVQIKQLEKGDRVGYDGTFVAKRPMKIGILPIGYNDGVDRRLSNKGTVLVGQQKCPIIGRVSMNITAISLEKVKNAKIGQEVTIFTSNPIAANSIENAAKLCQTIPYEFLIHLSPTNIRRFTI